MGVRETEVAVQRESAPRTLALATAIGILVSGGLLYLAARRVDVEQLRAALSTARWWPWVPLAVTSYLCGHLVRGYRCAALLRGQATLGTLSATDIVIAGYASNNVLPARLGEFVRVGILSARTGLPVWQSLSVTALERVVDGIAILALLMVASINTVASPWLTALTRVAGLVLGTAGIGLLAAVAWPTLPVSIASRIGARLGAAAHDKLVRTAGQLAAGVKNLRNSQVALRFVLASLLVWTLEAGMFVALLPAFGLEPDFWRGTLVMGVTNLGLLAPSTPGFVGTFHAFCAEALATQGVDPSVAMSFAVVAHLSFFVPVTLWGAVVLLASGVKLGATVGAVRAARNANHVRTVNGVTLHVISSETAHRTAVVPSPFLKSVVEALVARSDRDDDIDRRALISAAQFSAEQLAALSVLLQTAFAIGMGMFRSWVVLRYLTRFEKLPLARRRLAAESWAFGPITLFRMLFKPIRGVCVLAYYERRGAP